jgi:hypothetical protein
MFTTSWFTALHFYWRAQLASTIISVYLDVFDDQTLISDKPDSTPLSVKRK